MNTTTPTTSKLPDTPSALIRVALADLKKCEAMPETYRISMAMFHQPHGKTCYVCLAGAVMAQTLGVPKEEESHTYDHADCSKLLALDSFRAGDVTDGLCEMELMLPVGMADNKIVADYEDDPAQFHQDMEALAKELEAHGL